MAQPAIDRAEKASNELKTAEAEKRKLEAELINEKRRADKAEEEEARMVARGQVGTPTGEYSAALQRAREGMGLPVERLVKETSTPEKRMEITAKWRKFYGLDKD